MEKCKNWVPVYETFKNLLLQNCSTQFLDLHTNSPWVCVIKVCSNGGATYIIGEIIDLHTNSPWVCVIKVCSNGGSTYIIGELIAKDNYLNRKFNANL